MKLSIHFPLNAHAIPREVTAKFYLGIETHIPWKILIWGKVHINFAILTIFKCMDGCLSIFLF